MKKLLFILGCLISGCDATFAQRASDQLPAGVTPSSLQLYLLNKADTLHRQVWAYYGGGLSDYMVSYNAMRTYVAAAAPTTTGFTVLQQPTIGTVIAPGTSMDNIFKQLYAPPQNPTASLSSSAVYELTGNSTQSQTLSYSYGKVTGTSNILDAKLNGSTTGITQNSNGASGTVGVSFSTNMTTTYTLDVRTVDSPAKTASSTVVISYAPAIYYGYATSTTPTSTEILAVAGGGKDVRTGHNYPSGITVTPSGGAKYPFIAVAHNQGNITQFLDSNGYDVTSGFTTYKFTTTINNGIGTGGYSQSYDVYPYSTAVNSPFFFKTN